MENHTYKIEIKFPQDGTDESPVSNAGGTNGVSGDTSGGTSTGDSQSTGGSAWLTANANSAKSAVKSIVSFSTAASLADKLISYNISTVSLRTGATEYEQKLQYGYSLAKSTLMPVAVGAATGGLAGAVIGLAYSGVTQLITYAQNAQTIEYNRQLENISQGLAQTRAGVTGRRNG